MSKICHAKIGIWSHLGHLKPWDLDPSIFLVLLSFCELAQTHRMKISFYNLKILTLASLNLLMNQVRQPVTPFEAKKATKIALDGYLVRIRLGIDLF